MSFSIYSSQCYFCKHLKWTARGPTLRCAAFDRIPESILGTADGYLPDVFDHRQPYPGDNGIRWEPREPGVKHPFDQPENQ